MNPRKNDVNELEQPKIVEQGNSDACDYAKEFDVWALEGSGAIWRST